MDNVGRSGCAVHPPICIATVSRPFKALALDLADLDLAVHSR